MEQTEAFRVLASADRQLLLHELVARGGEETVTNISRQVAARRHRIPPENLSEDMVERAQIRLIHTHLPQLESNNVVIVDRDRGSVALLERPETAQLFDAAEELKAWPPNGRLDRSF